VPLITRDQAAAAHREFVRLGTVYARCFTPVEMIRERLRRQRLTGFLQAHAGEVTAIKSQANAVVERLRRRYKVLVPVSVATRA